MPNTKNVLFVTFAIIGLAVFFWLYHLPSAAFDEIRKAAEQGDEEKLAVYIDFPALKTSIRQNIIGVDGDQKKRTTPRPFAAIGRFLGNVIVNSVLDVVVSPPGISALVQGTMPDAINQDGKSEERSAPAEYDVRREYETLSRYVIRFLDKGSNNEKLALVMTRDGLSWKLSGVRIAKP